MSKVPTVEDINTFIETNLKSEFEILEEIQENCNADIKVFSRVLSKVDADTSSLIGAIIDHLTLANYSINNVKNNVAMKLYKREMTVKNELSRSMRSEETLESKITELSKELKVHEKERDKIVKQAEAAEEESKTLEKRANDLNRKLKELEKEQKPLKEQLKRAQGSRAKMEIKTDELTKQLKDLEAKENDYKDEVKTIKRERAKLEHDIIKLENSASKLEKERNSLKEQLEARPEEKELDAGFLREFNLHQTELKNNLKNHIKNWSKLRKGLETQDGKWDKNSDKAIKAANKKIEDLESELKDTEKKLKAKSTKKKAELTKKKTSIKQKLTRARNKYDTLKLELKSGSKNTEKITELKSELALLINDIASMEKEYDNLLKALDLKEDELIAIFEVLPSLTDLMASEIGTESKDELDKVIKESQGREKSLQLQLDTALKNVEELKVEIQEMDKQYHSEIKDEYDRLHKKLEAERKREFEKKLRNLQKEEIAKVEVKYKKILRETEDKFKKEIELAAQKRFELEHTISQLEQQEVSEPEKPSKPEPEYERIGTYKERKRAYTTNSYNVINGNMNGKGISEYSRSNGNLRKKLPKNGAISQREAQIQYLKEGNVNITIAKRRAKDKKKKMKKKKVAKGQCGACGEYVPINSDSCSNCGVKFSQPEEELGACGNCGNLIPISTRKCPICGAEFE